MLWFWKRFSVFSNGKIGACRAQTLLQKDFIFVVFFTNIIQTTLHIIVNQPFLSKVKC